jgi:truncated hemoglobin YjbI
MILRAYTEFWDERDMRELIYIVVEAFYQKATADILLGYHFARFNEPEVLASHLERITSFWEMQLTGKVSRPLEGKQFQLLFTHLQLGIKRGELGRWIVLFHQTLDELVTQFKNQATPEEVQEMELIAKVWKEKIAFFEERFKSHPQMFRQV